MAIRRPTHAFVADQGVVYAASALPLKQVASSPATGQYYGLRRRLHLRRRRRGRGGADLLHLHGGVERRERRVASQLIGPSVTFSANLFASDPTTGKQFSMLLYNCVADKLALGTKLEDFMVPELDFACFANAAGQVCQLNFGDAA